MAHTQALHSLSKLPWSRISRVLTMIRKSLILLSLDQVNKRFMRFMRFMVVISKSQTDDEGK